ADTAIIQNSQEGAQREHERQKDTQDEKTQKPPREKQLVCITFKMQDQVTTSFAHSMKQTMIELAVC
ncbi:hypothetical protein CSC81_18730, partial [Tenacibaculum discolor]